VLSTNEMVSDCCYSRRVINITWTRDIVILHVLLKVFVRYPADVCYFQRLLPELRYNLCWNLVNKTNLVHNLLLVYLSIFTCFGRLCANHQEKQLCLYDTWHLLFCLDDCLIWQGHTRLYSITLSYQTVIHTK
jgi:hypothetical protein